MFGIEDTYSQKSSREYTDVPIRVTFEGTRSAQPERETRGFLRGVYGQTGYKGGEREYNHLGNPPRCWLFGGGLARAYSRLSSFGVAFASEVIRF